MEEVCSDFEWDCDRMHTYSARPKAFRRVRKQEKKWTVDESKLLVIMMKSRESIWNPSCETYKNSEMKQRHWQEIAKKTQHSVVDAKNRWNSIKSRYNSVRKRVLSSKNNNGDLKYQPTFDLYDALQFLTNVPSKHFSKIEPLEGSTSTKDSFLDTSSTSPEVKTIDYHGDMCHVLVKKRRKTTADSLTTVERLESSFTSEFSGFLEESRHEPVSDKWKKVFSEYIFCELDRYAYDDAQNLKKQLTMVCVNFQTGQKME